MTSGVPADLEVVRAALEVQLKTTWEAAEAEPLSDALAALGRVEHAVREAQKAEIGDEQSSPSDIVEARNRIAFLVSIGDALNKTDGNLAQTAKDAQAFVAAYDEARALLTEAYPGEHLTNRWRKRVERLGAWPPAPEPGEDYANHYQETL